MPLDFTSLDFFYIFSNFSNLCCFNRSSLPVDIGDFSRKPVLEHTNASETKGVRTRMFWLIIYLPCFDPCVLFGCLVFCSFLLSSARFLLKNYGRGGKETFFPFFLR